MKEIILTKGYVAQVDDEDYELLNRYKWYAKVNSTIYYAARGCGNPNNKLMHRMIMNPPNDMVVDHLDGNGLNNQRYNLKVCTQSQNCRNNKVIRNELDNLMSTRFIPITGEYRLLKAIFER